LEKQEEDCVGVSVSDVSHVFRQVLSLQETGEQGGFIKDQAGCIIYWR
jgi:hypothetical protein